MKKVFLSGSTGMLGRYAIEALAKIDCELITSNRSFFDLNDPINIYKNLLDIKPNYIVHLAAETDVDLCERQPELGYVRNFKATEAIANAAKQIGAKVIYISTSNVFGSEGRLSYNELDMPYPVNYYGKSKLMGEKALIEIIPRSNLIIRAGWMIGGGREKDHKFVGKIVSQIDAGVKTLSAVSDKYGSITPASKLANFIVYAIKKQIFGLVHYASLDGATRYDMARVIASELSDGIKVLPVKSSIFPLSAPRPSFECIETIQANFFPDAVMPGCWNDELIEYIKSF